VTLTPTNPNSTFLLPFISSCAAKKKTDWVKKCMEYEVAGAMPKGRQKKTWMEIVEKDCQACKLNKEDAVDHKRWRKQIRND